MRKDFQDFDDFDFQQVGKRSSDDGSLEFFSRSKIRIFPGEILSHRNFCVKKSDNFSFFQFILLSLF